MRINLRKASVIQQALQDELKRDREESTTVRISVFDSAPARTLDQAAERIQAGLARSDRLLKALYTLRQIVARENAQAGITDSLAEEAHLAARESQIRRLLESDARLDDGQLATELLARRESKADSIYGGRDFTVSVSVLKQDFLDGLRKEADEIRRLRRRLRDDMVSTNVKTEIEVPEEVSQVLAELGLD